MRQSTLGLLLIALSFTACAKKPELKKALPTVTVTPVIQKTVPLFVEGVGHIEPINSVEIKSQVTGVMTDYYFKRGQDVKKGDLLISIDERPFQARVNESAAAVARNVADVKFAEDTARRNAPLVQDDYISQNSYDNLLTNVLTSSANLESAKAQLEEAKINLGYCSIHAPMDGRTSDLMVDPGNLILENANEPLLTLNQICPIYATFSISEKYLPSIQRLQRQNTLSVEAYVDDVECPPFHGCLEIIDNEVDMSTGMVKMKANMPNKEKFLWPGQFVTCHLILRMLDNALLIPEATIQNSTQGKYVFIVGEDNTIKKQMIEVGQRHLSSTRVVTQGLHPGQQVVLEGQINIYDGAKVTVTASKTAQEAVKVEKQIEQLGMPP